MRLLKLELLNLASLDKMEGEVINFEEGALGESTIFSIVGPTGSGKSTILDAICLALYNRAPRYPRKKGDKDRIEIYGEGADDEKNRLAPTDGRNILSRGKKYGYSKLTFLANNGTVYRAEWSVKMKVKRYEDALTSLYKLIERDGRMEEEEADWHDLPSIIGLDYEQFLRTVLIAQGSFANFLTAKENERYELLEKLVGCEDMYTLIADAVKERKDRAASSCHEMKARFAAFEKEDLSEEQLEELAGRIEQLEAADRKRKEELEAIKKSLAWYADEEKFSADMAQASAIQEEAGKKVEAMKEQAERLAKHDATLPAVGFYKDMKEKEKAIAVLESEARKLETEMADLTLKIGEEEKVLEGLKQMALLAGEELNRQRPHINKARTIQGELDSSRKMEEEKKRAKGKAGKELEEARKALEANREAIRKAEETLRKANEGYERLETETGKRQKELAEGVKQAREAYETEAVKLEGKDMDSLQKVKEQASALKNDLDEAITIRRSLDEKLMEMQEREAEEKECRKCIQEKKEALGKLTIEALETELETLRKTYTLMTSEKWELHRQSLSDECPCPLCGSKHHPYKDKDVLMPVVSELSGWMKEKESKLDKEKQSKEQWQKEINTNEGKLHTIGKNVLGIRKEMSVLAEKWNGVVARHADWPDEVSALQQLKPSVEEDFKKASGDLDEYCRIHGAVDVLRKDKENREAQEKNYLNDSTRKLEKAKDGKMSAEMALNTEKGKEENLQKQLEEKEKALLEAGGALSEATQIVVSRQEALKAEIGEKNPDAFEEELMKRQADAEADTNAKSRIVEDLKKRLEGKKGTSASIKEQREKNVQERNGKEVLLDEWLTDFNAQPEGLFTFTVDDIATLCLSSDNWEEIRKEKEERIQAYTVASTTYQNLEKAHQEHQKERPSGEKPVLEARMVELEEMDMSGLVEAKARLQRYHAAKEQMGAMYEEKQRTEQVLNDWTSISEAIGGADGKLLRKIAQCYTLKFLIEHANAEIAKFNSRYELLQVRNSLGIRVIDHDRADDVRDTTSLSGGETFIVSLGLALGLSSLSSRNISFENLFIDEGFGTLDPDTLATVIDSLAMLQNSQGKKVGVISHTDTMSERITTQIRIIKNGQSGSSRIEVYPG